MLENAAPFPRVICKSKQSKKCFSLTTFFLIYEYVTYVFSLVNIIISEPYLLIELLKILKFIVIHSNSYYNARTQCMQGECSMIFDHKPLFRNYNLFINCLTHCSFQNYLLSYRLTAKACLIWNSVSEILWIIDKIVIKTWYLGAVVLVFLNTLSSIPSKLICKILYGEKRLININ